MWQKVKEFGAVVITCSLIVFCVTVVMILGTKVDVEKQQLPQNKADEMARNIYYIKHQEIDRCYTAFWDGKKETPMKPFDEVSCYGLPNHLTIVVNLNARQ